MNARERAYTENVIAFLCNRHGFSLEQLWQSRTVIERMIMIGRRNHRNSNEIARYIASVLFSQDPPPLKPKGE